MRPRRANLGMRRKVFEKLDIADQRASSEETFKQIMTQQRIFRDSILECGIKSLDIVKSLAREDSLAENVLIQIGHCGGVRIEAAAGTDQFPIRRTFLGCWQQRRNARLKNRITRDYALLLRIEYRTVQRMRRGADQINHCAQRHACVRVQRQYESDLLRHGKSCARRCNERRG